MDHIIQHGDVLKIVACMESFPCRHSATVNDIPLKGMSIREWCKK